MVCLSELAPLLFVHYAEVIDFGLDPDSRLQQTGYLPQPPVEPAHRKKGGMSLDRVGEVVRREE